MAIHSKNKYVLINLMLIALLSLISCTSESNSPEKTSFPTSISPTDSFATLVNMSSTTIANIPISTPFPTSTLFSTPTYFLSVTPFPIPTGKVLYEAYDLINYTKYQVIKIETIGSNSPIMVIEFGRNVDGQQVNLFSANMTWSPDGHWFAFVGTDMRADTRIYTYQDIFISSMDGSDIYRLTYSPQYDKYDLAWSPDGSSILVAMGKNGTSDLYLVSTKSGEIIRRLTSSGRAHTVAWSPDGKRLVFEENSKLNIMNLVDLKLHLLSDLPVSYRKGVSWSPDGTQIAFAVSAESEDCNDIYVANVNTGETVNVTSSNISESSPSWSPDGKFLAFSRASYTCGGDIGEGYWNIFITNLKGEEWQVVSDAGFWASIAWLPVPNLEIDKQYTVTELGGNLNLRTEPLLNGKILAKLPAGEVITVFEGLVDADDYYWWKIRTQDGTEGWAVEVANWYKPLNQ